MSLKDVITTWLCTCLTVILNCCVGFFSCCIGFLSCCFGCLSVLYSYCFAASVAVFHFPSSCTCSSLPPLLLLEVLVIRMQTLQSGHNKNTSSECVTQSHALVWGFARTRFVSPRLNASVRSCLFNNMHPRISSVKTPTPKNVTSTATTSKTSSDIALDPL